MHCPPYDTDCLPRGGRKNRWPVAQQKCRHWAIRPQGRTPTHRSHRGGVRDDAREGKTTGRPQSHGTLCWDGLRHSWGLIVRPFQKQPPPQETFPILAHHGRAPTFVIFKPHPKLGQDVVPQSVTELKDLRDCGQRKGFSARDALGPTEYSPSQALWRAADAQTQTPLPPQGRPPSTHCLWTLLGGRWCPKTHTGWPGDAEQGKSGLPKAR